MILGIDPGSKGALALLSEPGGIEIVDMPTFMVTVNRKKKARVDMHQLARIVFNHAMEHTLVAVLENVHSMPAQGVASSFTFGRNFGACEMALAANVVPVHYVEPRAWKAILKVPADKDGARKRASELMPQHAHLWSQRSHDGRAEAALLAFYGRLKGVHKHG